MSRLCVYLFFSKVQMTQAKTNFASFSLCTALFLGKKYCQVGQHWTAGQYWAVIPFPWKLTVCVIDRPLKVSASHIPNFWNVPIMTFNFLFLPKMQFSNERLWCFETKLRSKVIFFQQVQGCIETFVWSVRVTDCYCSGGRNSNKFF